MLRSLLLPALLALLGLLFSCARDVNPPEAAVRYPAQVNLYFRTRGSFQEGMWYYMVFNFSAAPNITTALAPLDEISDEDRGRNWEMYIAYHKPVGGNAELTTLRRPNQPTVLETDAGPTDAQLGDFNSDTINDIVIPCRAADIVQIILGKPTDTYNTTYFEGAQDIVVSAGSHPSLVLVGDVSGEAPPDLVVFYDAADAASAFMRVIQSDGSGLFDPVGSNIVLGGTPVDALLQDFNGNGELDLAVVTKDANGQGTLRIFTGDGAGAFTAGGTQALGLNPVALASGQLDDPATTLDLVVANRGSGTAGATDSSVMVLHGDGLAGFAAPNPVLPVPGPCDGVAVGKYIGAMDDIAVTYVGKYKLSPTAAEQTGALAGVYLNEAALPVNAATVPLISPLGLNPPGVQPNFIAALDTAKDGNIDAVVLGGRPGGAGRTLYIQRGGRQTPVGGGTAEFIWEGETITYITELEPARIRVGDINQDGTSDFLIPCPAGGSGNRLCLYYGLGKSNYTSADIYWFDFQEPELLAAQNWLLTPPQIGPNSIALSIDPFLFYDLGQQPPYVPDGFNVDFMTCTAGIQIDDNLNHLGEVRDHLQSPVNVKMEAGFLDDEQNSPRASQNVAEPSSVDVDFWRIEVI